MRSLGKQSQRRCRADRAFPRRTFSKLELTIEGVHRNVRNGPVQMNAVGINELRLVDDVPGAEPIRVTESQRVPTALLDAMGTKSRTHPLALVLSSDPTMDTEALSRTFSLPTDRSFAVTGQVHLGKDSDDDAIDRALGIPDAAQGGITVTSTDRCRTCVAGRRPRVDGDPATAWVASVVDQQPAVQRAAAGDRRRSTTSTSGSFADGRHSTVGRITIRADGGSARSSLPAGAEVGAGRGGGRAGQLRAVDRVDVRGRGHRRAADEARWQRPADGHRRAGDPGVRRAAEPAELPGRAPTAPGGRRHAGPDAHDRSAPRMRSASAVR